MKFSAFLFAAPALGNIVFETAWNTDYVTVDGDGSPAPTSTSSSLNEALSHSHGPDYATITAVTSAAASPSSSASSSSAAPLNYAEIPKAPSLVTSESPATTSSSEAAPSTTTSNTPAPPSTSSSPPPAPITTTSEDPTTTSSTVAPPPPPPSTTSTSASETSASSTSSSAPSPTQSGLDSFAQSIVDYHNQVRSQHNAGNIEWDDGLASYAQNYLNGDNCVFKHSGGPNGENIALGYQNPVDACKAWYGENTQYNYNDATFTESTGHFTQMVWKGTTKVGCAQAQCSGGEFLVCEYSPRGNVLGQFAQNVLQ